MQRVTKDSVDDTPFRVQVDCMLQMIERGFFKTAAIKLSDTSGSPASINPPVQVLRVGKFNHPKYGEFEITPLTLQEMKQNFDQNVRGVDVAFDYFHDSDKEASGWPTDLYLSEDGSELWANVDWTPKARQKLSEREIRYFSPDFAFQWKDPETGKLYKNVLFGGGLTNRPFVKDMAAIVAAEEKAEQMKIDELEKVVLKLSEDQKGMADKHAALQAENDAMKKKLAEYAEKAAPPAAKAPPADAGDSATEEEDSDDDVDSLKKQLADAKKQLAELGEKTKKAEEAKQMAEKENEFNILLSEGKACAAQKTAFIKGDTAAFAKLAQKVNLSANGHGGSGDGDAEGTREDRVMKLAEEKCKSDSKLSKVDAITLANKEIK